jgi:hypothetical protein
MRNIYATLQRIHAEPRQGHTRHADDGQFAMSIDELRHAMDLSERQAEVATMWAAEREWIRRRANQVELKAAGIYVAKVTLQLPR